MVYSPLPVDLLLLFSPILKPLMLYQCILKTCHVLSFSLHVIFGRYLPVDVTKRNPTVENLSNMIHGMVLCVEQEYSLFEQNVNPMIAEKLTGERSRDYMMARRVAKENHPALSPLYESGATRPHPRSSAVFFYARASAPYLLFCHYIFQYEML